MTILKQYNNKVVKYDLINKFNYKTIANIPKLHYIVLNFNVKKGNIKSLITLMSSLKLIALQTPKITTSKVSNIAFKIRKGQPIGCQVILRNDIMNMILFKLLNKNFPKLKPNQIKNKSFSITLNNILIFKELEQNYQFFKNLPNLSIYLNFNTNTYNEFYYLLQSYKICYK